MLPSFFNKAEKRMAFAEADYVNARRLENSLRALANLKPVPTRYSIPSHPFRYSPPAYASNEHLPTAPSVVFMGESPVFVVRPLPPAGLDGAFRVHLVPKDLEKLGLSVGDTCQLCDEDGNVFGYAISWRSADAQLPKPGAHPIKLTDTLRDAYSLKLGTHVKIVKADGVRTGLARKVSVVELCFEQPNGLEVCDNDDWKYRCITTLCNAEAFVQGVAFEVTAKKGLKKRYLIENIEPTPSSGICPVLFHCNDHSELHVLDGPPTQPSDDVTTADLMLSLDGIGGLLEQAKEINKRLHRLNAAYKVSRKPSPTSLDPDQSRADVNKGILIYGYEGTGKTMLLEHIAEAGWKRVCRLRRSQLSGTAVKNEGAIQSVFSEAKAGQPSAVLIDNLDAIAENKEDPGSSTSNVVDALANEMDKIKGMHVLVLATARHPNSVNSELTKPHRLGVHIELPVPDSKARTEILGVLETNGDGNSAEIADSIGARTHGYTGGDLVALHSTAQDIAQDRCEAELDDWVKVHELGTPSSTATAPTSPKDCLDGTVHSHAAAKLEYTDGRSTARLILQDFEKALDVVRPTAMKEVFLEIPKLYWKDVGGSEQMREAFDEMIGWRLQNPDMMDECDLEPGKGVLLYGPPGCSKTLTAQAVATSYGLNFIAVKGAELISMYVGESERAVREVFRKARAAQPSIVFFDEIDSIGADRDSGGTKGLNVLTTLLNEMDGIESLKGVLIFAATNKPELLDPALLRPGRFDKLIYIGLPSSTAREDIIKIRTRKIACSGDLDYGKMVQWSDGFSGAEVVKLCTSAKEEVMRRRLKGGPKELCMRDFERGVQGMVPRISQEMLDGYARFEKGAKGL